MFTKILIANRGEIACRVAATARRLGIRTVAVYSDADARAKHVLACDEAVHIGPPSPKESYLRGERIIEAAIATGAQAVHPGYGFLSENEEFAQACADAGLAFIGPPASAIKAMGLKAESKRLMQQAGVPLVPGYHGADQDAALLKREADRIGYPVLIKASAGGGGKGMRAVGSSAEFDAALASCQREAINSFGDDAVLVERYVTRPRHIEIQVFGDTQGNDDLRFYFMEMNTRLQVEHPVTEAITGLDLVEWQLRVAAGEPLPLRQQDLRIHGHAIEARICAENPDAQFLPATGRLDIYRTPPAASFERADVRFDAGVREGDAITPHYDSMIAKLIVWGADRAQALARLDAALAQTHIVGLHTNVAFLRRVVQTRSFAQADLDTALIERERAVLFNAPPLPIEVAAAGVVAHALATEQSFETDDPWSRRDGWRLHGAAVRRFDIEAQGAHHVARLERAHGGAMWLVLGERRWPFSAALRSDGGDGVHDVTLANERHVLTVYATGERISIFTRDGQASLHEIDPIAHAADGAVEGGRLTAPMPGKVIAFLAQPGDVVKLGQPLAVMEAMKMEHTITAPRDGTVQELLYAAGDQVSEGGELLRLAS